MFYVKRPHVIKESLCEKCDERVPTATMWCVHAKCRKQCCNLTLWVCPECINEACTFDEWLCREELDDVFWWGDNAPRIHRAYAVYDGMPVSL